MTVSGASSPAAPASSTAVFRGRDTTTRGHWNGMYGAQGYSLINNAFRHPAYAKITTDGTPHTWAASSTDPRALQRPMKTSAVASCWYTDHSSFTIDLNLIDGGVHQVALYALDWDSRQRSERIDVLDVASGALLDTRTIARFHEGQYLVWTLSGHVALRVTNASAANAVVSGLFFDPVPPAVTTVTLPPPATGSTYTAPATIQLTAIASARPGGRIARVDFLNGATVIGSAATIPETLSYGLSWTNLVPGTYALSARATDNTGTSVTSPPLAITMSAKPIPSSVSVSAAAALLVRSTDLLYQGAFRLAQGPVGGSSFDYGGTALTFNPVGGSLFVVGHDWHQQVAEVAVPAIRRATSVADLAVATVLQPFTDATEGRMQSVAENPKDTVKVGGLLPYRGQLYLTAYRYYDASATQTLSHFVSGLDLSVKGDVRGPYRPNWGAGFLAGYFGLVPQEWQRALGGPVLNGQCCLSIISRTSYGPAAFAIDPTQLGKRDPLPVVPLLYYTADHPLGRDGADSTLFNFTTQMGGVVFPEGTRTVLFFGKQGLGPYCYGTGEECHDPSESAKGGHGYPYAYYVWAYDAVDLAAVHSGERQPWDVQPYAVWALDLPFAGGAPHRILGAAYDPQTARIFLSQDRGDGANPVIHVFTIGSASSSPPPPSPPTVSLVSPANGATFAPFTPIAVTATATDRDGSVSAVAFYVNGALIGTDSSSPYSVNWSGAGVGAYQLTAVATDNVGNDSTASATVMIAGSSWQTLLTTQLPASPSVSNGPAPWELGTKIVSDVSGQITAIRFWKSPSETGPHVGHIWSATGQMLAAVTFTDETGSDWQQQALPLPISVLANTEYAVSVSTGSNAYFAFTLDGLAAGLVNGHLRTPAGNGGLYGPSGVFPASAIAHNYFRDIVFVVDDAGEGGDTTAPTVSINQPTGGSTVRGQVTIEATASDDVGVAGVQFQIDGVDIGGEKTAAPYSLTWDTVSASNGARTLTAVARDAADHRTRTSVTVTVANVLPSQTLLTTQVPATPSVLNGTNPWELGTNVVSDVSGQITAIRFWKSPSENRPHIGHIWSAQGQMLASVRFTNETASGWQQQALRTPVPVLANTEYVVSVSTGPNAYFAFTIDALAPGLVNGHLRAPAGNSGRYGASRVFPASALPHNYFRDVVFVADDGR